jgi:hypothetical protein
MDRNLGSVHITCRISSRNVSPSSRQATLHSGIHNYRSAVSPIPMRGISDNTAPLLPIIESFETHPKDHGLLQSVLAIYIITIRHMMPSPHCTLKINPTKLHSSFLSSSSFLGSKFSCIVSALISPRKKPKLTAFPL